MQPECRADLFGVSFVQGIDFWPVLFAGAIDNIMYDVFIPHTGKNTGKVITESLILQMIVGIYQRAWLIVIFFRWHGLT